MEHTAALEKTPNNFEKHQDAFLAWLKDGNAALDDNGYYREQTTQWNITFTLTALKAFFIREFRSD